MSRKTPGEVRARTCGTKSPSRWEALRFIDSSKSPSQVRARTSPGVFRDMALLGLCLELSFTRIVRWPKNYDLIKNAVWQCQEKWANRLRVPRVVLEEWVTTVLSKVRAKIESLSRKGSACVAKSIFAYREMHQSLKDLHERYVVSTADKAGNNVVCKKFYHERILSELGACPGRNETKGTSTYKACLMSVENIIKSHVDFCKRYGIDLATAQRSLPYFHWLPKLHKKAVW